MVVAGANAFWRKEPSTWRSLDCRPQCNPKMSLPTNSPVTDSSLWSRRTIHSPTNQPVKLQGFLPRCSSTFRLGSPAVRNPTKPSRPPFSTSRTTSAQRKGDTTHDAGSDRSVRRRRDRACAYACRAPACRAADAHARGRRRRPSCGAKGLARGGGPARRPWGRTWWCAAGPACRCPPRSRRVPPRSWPSRSRSRPSSRWSPPSACRRGRWRRR
jgi:hypothetical protein